MGCAGLGQSLFVTKTAAWPFADTRAGPHAPPPSHNLESLRVCLRLCGTGSVKELTCPPLICLAAKYTHLPPRHTHTQVWSLLCPSPLSSTFVTSSLALRLFPLPLSQRPLRHHLVTSPSRCRCITIALQKPARRSEQRLIRQQTLDSTPYHIDKLVGFMTVTE